MRSNRMLGGCHSAHPRPGGRGHSIDEMTCAPHRLAIGAPTFEVVGAARLGRLELYVFIKCWFDVRLTAVAAQVNSVVMALWRWRWLSRAGAAVMAGSLAALLPQQSMATVIGGSDERAELTTAETETKPHRSIVMIERRINDQWRKQCTGFVYDSTWIATAAHCVSVGGSGSSAPSAASPGVFRVIPAQSNNGNTRPYGICSVVTVKVNPSYLVPNPQLEHDFGALKFSCPGGQTAATLGKFNLTNAFGVNTEVGVSGYPNAAGWNVSQLGSQWKHNDPINNQNTYHYKYSVDTTTGQSGSPVFRGNTCTTSSAAGCAGAVHIYGGDYTMGVGNYGVRMRTSVRNTLYGWT